MHLQCQFPRLQVTMRDQWVEEDYHALWSASKKLTIHTLGDDLDCVIHSCGLVESMS
jgi:hypothetical protein